MALAQWPSVSSYWTVAKSGASDLTFLLQLVLSFDPSPYNPPQKGASDTWQTRAKVAFVSYSRLLEQLTDPNGISFTVEATLLQQPMQLSAGQIGSVTPPGSGLLGWLLTIWTFLQNRSQGKVNIADPTQKTFTIEVEPAKTLLNRDQIFKMECQLIISRSHGCAEGDFAAIPGVRKVATLVTSRTSVAVKGQAHQQGDPAHQGLELFALDVENTLSAPGSYTLTVATGPDRLAAGVNNLRATVWGMRLGENSGQGIHFEINDANAPQIYAPRPISNQRITKDVSVHGYDRVDDFDPATNQLTGGVTQLTFPEVELDDWVHKLFHSLDQLLAPEYVSSLLVIDKKTTQHPQGVSSFLSSLNQQKKALAKAGSALMSPVYSGQMSTRLESAKEALHQELLV